MLGFGKEVLTPQFSANSFLQQLGRRKASGLQLFIQFVGQVHLHAWHTPNIHPWRKFARLGTFFVPHELLRRHTHVLEAGHHDFADGLLGVGVRCIE